MYKVVQVMTPSYFNVRTFIIRLHPVGLWNFNVYLMEILFNLISWLLLQISKNVHTFLTMLFDENHKLVLLKREYTWIFDRTLDYSVYWELHEYRIPITDHRILNIYYRRMKENFPSGPGPSSLYSIKPWNVLFIYKHIWSVMPDNERCV